MVEYLKIDSNEIPVRINRRVIVLFGKQSGKGLANLDNLDIDGLTRLLYLGACEGYRFLGEKNPFGKKDKFEDELDKLSLKDFMKQASDVLAKFLKEDDEETEGDKPGE